LAIYSNEKTAARPQSRREANEWKVRKKIIRKGGGESYYDLGLVIAEGIVITEGEKKNPTATLKSILRTQEKINGGGGAGVENLLGWVSAGKKSKVTKAPVARKTKKTYKIYQTAEERLHEAEKRSTVERHGKIKKLHLKKEGSDELTPKCFRVFASQSRRKKGEEGGARAGGRLKNSKAGRPKS